LFNECLLSIAPSRRLPLSLALPAPGTASPKPKSQLQLWPILYTAPKLSKTKHIPRAPTPPYEIAGAEIAYLDKTLKVWELESGAPVATFTCDSAALCCAFIGNRKLIAGDALGRVHFLSLEMKNLS
jgi:hypothetical protein